MSVQEDLDALYGVAPEDFTALRQERVAAAKQRGDADAAKVIAAARRPTAAAWVVNVLVRVDPTAKTRLRDLTAQLQAAHAAMDGPRIRELSGVQRTVIAELARAALAAADLPNPTAALRNDVIDTLQAAVADPEVAGRLGRLEKAAEWSGFGDFGAVSAQVSAPAPVPELKVDRRAAEKHRRAVAAAERGCADAQAAVADRTTALATARRRYEELLQTLSAAEHAVDAAEDTLQQANSDLAQADSALAALRADSPD